VIKPGLDEEKEIAESQNNASMSSVYVRGNWNIHSFCLESIRIAKKVRQTESASCSIYKKKTTVPTRTVRVCNYRT
jgi:hypothetical protein